MWSSLTSTVSSLASSVTSTLTRIFSIHSPSKVWEEIGEYLDAGLVNGIKGGAKSVLSTTANLAKSVNGSMEIDTPKMPAARSTTSSIDMLSSKFDGFIDSLKSIANTLTAAETFAVPSIAAGTAIPYKVKANTLAGSDTSLQLSEGLQSGMNDQTEIMSEVMYLLSQILDVIRKFNLKIDADSIVNTITYLQRSNERNYGGV